jgi:hypothetical protein
MHGAAFDLSVGEPMGNGSASREHEEGESHESVVSQLRPVAKRKRQKTAPPKIDRWPQIRAAIIAYVVVFNVLAAIPTPGNITQETLDRPINRAELTRWVRLFRSVGIDTDEKSLGDWYLGFAKSMENARAWVVKPIDPWMQFTQTWQGWRLFGMPDERPYALKIAVLRKGESEVIYQSGDWDKRWNASLLEYRRVRALYNPGGSGPPNTYTGFGARISDQIFEEMPDVDRVTISHLQSHTTLPGEPPDPKVEEVHLIQFNRKKK